MNDSYTIFIKGKIFTKKSILKILTKNKINAQIIDSKYYQFRKKYLKIIKFSF